MRCCQRGRGYHARQFLKWRFIRRALGINICERLGKLAGMGREEELPWDPLKALGNPLGLCRARIVLQRCPEGEEKSGSLYSSNHQSLEVIRSSWAFFIYLFFNVLILLVLPLYLQMWKRFCTLLWVRWTVTGKFGARKCLVKDHFGCNVDNYL